MVSRRKLTSVPKIFDIGIKAKQVRNVFNTCRKRASKLLQIIHSDICRRIEPPTYDEKNLFLTVVDKCTYFDKVYLLKIKDYVFIYLNVCFNKAGSNLNRKISKTKIR